MISPKEMVAAPARASRGPFPARMATVLGRPSAGFNEIERLGGGVRDTLWLVVLGTICFRSDSLARHLLALSDVGFLSVLIQLVQPFSAELRAALMVTLPAAVVITLAAGRGKRNFSRDLELGAACFVPFFAVMALARTAQLPGLLGPLSAALARVPLLLAFGAAAVYLFGAVRVARGRGPVVFSGVSEPAEATLSAQRSAHRELFGRLVVTAVAMSLGLSLAANVLWAAQHRAELAPLATGGDAPSFDLPRVDGAPGRLASQDLAGRVSVLDFWATWCPPCVAMLPTLHELSEKWAGHKVAFVGIHTPDVPAAEIRAFLKKHPTSYPILQDDSAGSVAGAFKVSALPHVVVLDKAGRVDKVFWGRTTRASLDKAIEQALSRSSSRSGL